MVRLCGCPVLCFGTSALVGDTPRFYVTFKIPKSRFTDPCSTYLRIVFCSCRSQKKHATPTASRLHCVAIPSTGRLTSSTVPKLSKLPDTHVHFSARPIRPSLFSSKTICRNVQHGSATAHKYLRWKWAPEQEGGMESVGYRE